MERVLASHLDYGHMCLGNHHTLPVLLAWRVAPTQTELACLHGVVDNPLNFVPHTVSHRQKDLCRSLAALHVGVKGGVFCCSLFWGQGIT